MPKLISNPTISDPWTPVLNTHDPIPFHLVRGAARTPSSLESRDSSTTRNSPSDPAHSTVQLERPPQSVISSSLFNPNDPAFSSDPYQHPDHHGLSLSDGLGKGGPSSASYFAEADHETEPPPAYDDSAPVSSEYLGRPHLQYESTSSLTSDSVEDVRGSGHLRERAQTSSPSTPFSSTSSLSQSRQGAQDHMADQEELLAYLQEDWVGVDDVREREIPISLRPRMGLPVTSQVPLDSQSRGRAGPDTSGILRSTTLPLAAVRTVSEPLATTHTERPHLPRRGNTTSPRRTIDLDRIDELDETTPLGMPLHHRGPYEMQGKVDTPPMRATPLDRQHQPTPKQHVLVAATPASAPPAPVPFRLNLKPGEFLTRIPPTRSRTAPPDRNSPLATGVYSPVAVMQPLYQQPRPIVRDQSGPRYTYRDNERNEWSPEQLYENQEFPSQPTIPKDVSPHSYRADTRNNPPSSASNLSRAATRPNIGSTSSSDQSLPQPKPPRQKQVTFQQLPQQSSQLSRSISQPSYPPSSAASAYSASSSSLSRAPPSSADRHRPRRIVLPAPLQQQNQNFMQALPSDMNRVLGQNGVPAQPTAAVIPVHDPKKGNLLKKRASTGSPTHQNHRHLVPERAPSAKGLFSFGGSFGKGLVEEPEPKLPKASRKLSKRRNAV